MMARFRTSPAENEMQELIRKYHSGAYVFRENEDGDYAFIVRTGKIRDRKSVV